MLSLTHPEQRDIMTSTRSTLAALLIAVVALAGCSAGQEEPAQPIAAVAATSASPTPSPTPTPPTKAQAGKIYLAAVGPANKCNNKLNPALKAGNLKRIRAAAKVCEKANRVFLAVLTSTEWPDGVQAHADSLSEKVAADQSAYTALTVAKKLSDVDDALAGMSLDNSQAQLIRVKLGLAAAPAI